MLLVEERYFLHGYAVEGARIIWPTGCTSPIVPNGFRHGTKYRMSTYTGELIQPEPSTQLTPLKAWKKEFRTLYSQIGNCSMDTVRVLIKCPGHPQRIATIACTRK